MRHRGSRGSPDADPTAGAQWRDARGGDEPDDGGHHPAPSDGCDDEAEKKRKQRFSQRGPPPVSASLTAVPPLLLLGLVGSIILSPRSTWDGRGELPQSIVVQDAAWPAPGGARRRLLPVPPSLRGCCGAPTEFRWVFLDSAQEATAGTPFRTRVLALDANGRQARPSACGELRVGLDLSGRARLSRETSPTAWRNSELDLNIENERAEVVQAEVRIQSPDPAADVLLHTSRISFASGPARGFSLRLRSRDEAGSGHAERLLPRSWPLGAPLEVSVSMQDRFGNDAPMDGSFNGGLAIRCDRCEAIDLTPRDGVLRFNGAGESYVATLRGLRPGTMELWLERIGGNHTLKQQREFRSSTALVIEFRDGAAPAASMPAPPGEGGLSPADAKWRGYAGRVREEFLHAWRGYRKYAWGHDELQPLSKSGKDTFGGIGATVIDSLTTLWLMGLREEFAQAREFVRDSLDFDRANEQISVFELTIRGLGGLLGAYALSGEQVFLDRAKELGIRLLPAFDTNSRLPLPKCNIATGKCASSKEPVILSEAGSVQLELRCLSEQTGDPRFRDAGDAAFEAIQSGGMTGILPVFLSPPWQKQVRVLSSKFAFGALADSYYEYLLKQWLQWPGEERFKELWVRAMDELPDSLVRPKPSEDRGTPTPRYKMIEATPSGDAIWKMDHLSCFAPAMTALGVMTLPERDLAEQDRNRTWLRMAEGMTAACVELWKGTKSGLAPEYIRVRSTAPHDYAEIPRSARHSFLRPETAESLFYLYRLTGDEKYREWGADLFNAIVEHGKVEGGYSSVKDVGRVPTEKLDEMQSFVMAETFKYLYLLFSPAETLDLRRFVLNTEGHPLPKYQR